MGRFLDWLSGNPHQLAEAAPSKELVAPTAKQVRRQGYEYGVPIAGKASAQTAASQERIQILDQLYQAYLTCPWVSSPIDLIARTVTAGGLQVVTDEDTPEGEEPAEPPEVQRLKRLMRFCNPREDMVQLLRNAVIDLLLFGDAYLEVVCLLGEPVALYTLDATTMTAIVDEHGEVSGYIQQVDGVGGTRKTEFEPDQVIHISLDAPRGGVYGVSPANKALLPVTAWLFVEATLKECFRRGDPPRVHVDLQHMSDTDVQRWREQYQVFNLGPKAVGTPLVTTNGGQVQVLDPRKVMDYLSASKQLRDEIIACFGCPPAKLGIIETGNLGGGTGEAQDKTFRVNTVIPVQALILEKINYHLVQEGFGITGWHLEFEEIDYRDSKIVEEIRDMRLHNGAYTLNRYRDEIGEPAVEGGDEPVLVDRQGAFLWRDLDAMSKANVVKTSSALADDVGVTMPDPPPMVAAPPGQAPPGRPVPPAPGQDPKAKPPRENAFELDSRRLNEAWQRSYRARRRQALAELPGRES